MIESKNPVGLKYAPQLEKIEKPGDEKIIKKELEKRKRWENTKNTR